MSAKPDTFRAEPLRNEDTWRVVAADRLVAELNEMSRTIARCEETLERDPNDSGARNVRMIVGGAFDKMTPDDPDLSVIMEG
jgi:hypothetical protein